MTKPGLYVAEKPLALVGLELCTPLGWSAEVTAAEMDAGVLAFRQTDDGEVDGVEEAPVASRWSAIPAAATRGERLRSLATAAFAAHLRAIQAWPGAARLPPVPLLLAVTEIADDDDDAAEAEAPAAALVRDALKELAAVVAPGVRIAFADPATSSVATHSVPLAGGRPAPRSTTRGGVSPTAADGDGDGGDGGRAAFLALLARGVELIRSGRAPAAIVGAVDTFCDADSMRRLAAQSRILGSGCPDGLIPGEAAAFGLLIPVDLLGGWTRGRGLRLEGVSLARDPCPFSRKEEPNLSEGLTRAFRQLRAHPSAGARAVSGVLSCQTGETFWAEEFSRAYLRNTALMPEPLQLRTLGLALGDVGTAAAAVQFATADWSARRRTPQAAGARWLVYACDDDGLCAAASVSPLALADTGSGSGARPRAPNGPEPLDALLDHVLVDSAALDAQLVAHTQLHAEEIGFLLAQREAVFTSAELSWRDAAAHETRIRRHFEAVRAWGKPARRLLLEKGLAASDPDDFSGAAFVLASLEGDESAWSGALRLVLASDPKKQLPHWERALRWALAEGGLGNRLAPLLSAERPAVLGLAARVIAYRGEGNAPMLCSLLERSEALDPVTRGALCDALGALRYQPAAGALVRAARRHPGEVAPSLALHLLGDPAGLVQIRFALVHGLGDPGALMLALAMMSDGEPSDADLLVRPRAAAARDVDSDENVARCVALGVLGSPAAVAMLLERLGHRHPEVRLAAAHSLERISGLRTSASPAPASPPPASMPEPEPTSDLGGAQRDGDVQQREAAEQVARRGEPVVDAEFWRRWWRDHEPQLRVHARLRGGGPYSLEACWNEAAAPGTRQSHRQLAIQELRLRLGPLAPLNADDFVEKQSSALEVYRAGCAQRSAPASASPRRTLP